MENQGEIKSKLSNPAKILMGYMKATGITDAKTIATNLDIPLRTVQRLKLECATCANDAISGVSDDTTCANDARYGAPKTPDMALSRADSNIINLGNNNTTPGESREIADELARQAYQLGLEIKAGKVAKSARSERRTKGELDGSKGITFENGELTVDADTERKILRKFPGVDVQAVCDKAAPEVAKMNHPSRDDAAAVIGKWARIQVENNARKPQHTGAFRRDNVVPYVPPKQSKGISQAELEAMVIADEAAYAR